MRFLRWLKTKPSWQKVSPCPSVVSGTHTILCGSPRSPQAKKSGSGPVLEDSRGNPSPIPGGLQGGVWRAPGGAGRGLGLLRDPILVRIPAAGFQVDQWGLVTPVVRPKHRHFPEALTKLSIRLFLLKPLESNVLNRGEICHGGRFESTFQSSWGDKGGRNSFTQLLLREHACPVPGLALGAGATSKTVPALQGPCVWTPAKLCISVPVPSSEPPPSQMLGFHLTPSVCLQPTARGVLSTTT